MSCSLVYDDTVTPWNVRVQQAVAELQAAGWPKAGAQSIVAISANESNVQWSLRRESNVAGDIYPMRMTPCRNRRQILGFESAFYNGHPAFKDGSISPAVEAQLIKRGYAFRSSGHLWPTNAFGPRGKAIFLELIMTYRDSPALSNLSIGPTQIYLHNTPLRQPSSTSVPQWRALNFPSTWEELYAMYFACSAQPYSKYLMYLKASWYPAMDINDRERSAQWLARNTGSVELGRIYYDGGQVGSSGPVYSSYRRNLENVMNYTR